MNTYESTDILHQYLFFHYGKPESVLPWQFGPRDALGYPRRCITEGFPIDEPPSTQRRGLDIGCATGRSTFEMARYCDEVIGIDYSAAFIEAAETIRLDGRLEYRYLIEGSRYGTGIAERPSGIDPDRIHFDTGDAHRIPEDLGTFDWVLGANLLCRLHHPRQFLDRLTGLVRPGGILVLNSPFSWLTEFTDPSEWVGATPENGASADVLKSCLAPHFDYIGETQMPFLIPETARKYQWTVAHSGRWRRRADASEPAR